MKIILVTGGSGSGKSTVCKMLTDYQVIDMDKIGHDVLQLPKIQAQIKKELDISGQNFDELKSGIIEKITIEKNNQILKNIMHPVMVDEFFKLANEDIVFLDAALHSDFIKYIKFDKVIKITAPLDVRIDLLMKRNNITKTKALEYINLSDQYQLDKFDYIIQNNSDIIALQLKVNEVIKKIIS